MIVFHSVLASNIIVRGNIEQGAMIAVVHFLDGLICENKIE